MKKQMLAIYIEKGVIALVEDIGEIGYYRQRGISKMTDREIEEAIVNGSLDEYIEEYDELPKGYGIYFEDEEVMGVAGENFKY